MSEPFLGEIRYFSFNFAPTGWALCNGQILPINQNTALFSLLGTFFGGNGTSNFALPNLQGRVPVGGQGGGDTVLGQGGGEESHTLLLPEIPTHTHQIAGGGAATTANPSGGYLATATAGSPYASPPASAPVVLAAAVTTVGGGQAHENRQPFLTVTACIALQGVFPSRN